MEKLTQGILRFRQNHLDAYRQQFAHLQNGQSPKVLFVTCSDSRVVPNSMTGTEPGDLFMLRNVGNIIPPYSAQDASVGSVLEYAVLVLNVTDIVVCGHSDCGAMHAVLEQEQVKEPPWPFLQRWLSYAVSSESTEVDTKLQFNSTLTTCNQTAQRNVLLQLRHLATYPMIQEHIHNQALTLHGWWFQIATADMYHYDANQKQFLLI